MWPFQKQIRMIRYLCFWRVNSSLAVLPNPFSVELSKVLCTIISSRLPTRDAGKWKKCLLAYDNFIETVKSQQAPKTSELTPELSWPIQSVLFVYPCKNIYGNGEKIVWELKLFGEDASHEFFIEVILPAMEEASLRTDSSWNYRNCIWGNFDIEAIYLANQDRWDPLVSEGRLDLQYNVTSLQYTDDIFNKYSDPIKYNYRKIVWLTPFDFSSIFSSTKKYVQTDVLPVIDATPTLYGIVDALLYRLHSILEGKRTAPENVWNCFSEQETNQLHTLMDEIKRINTTNTDILPSQHVIGHWIGHQTFARIPYTIYPYLELASMLHIGRQTHVGCGTFQIVKYPAKYDSNSLNT
ncbi:MAG: hypothetical protein HQK77_00775 [Desulfobacterales bacterium]|nr:hypothetical protein [Desulfobacterales bacterium]